jgi:hypothetical protein
MHGLGLKPGLQHDRLSTKRLSHGLRNYGIRFVFSGTKLYQLS